MPSKLTRSAILLLACAAIVPAAGCAGKKAKTDPALGAQDRLNDDGPRF